MVEGTEAVRQMDGVLTVGSPLLAPVEAISGGIVDIGDSFDIKDGHSRGDVTEAKKGFWKDQWRVSTGDVGSLGR